MVNPDVEPCFEFNFYQISIIDYIILMFFMLVLMILNGKFPDKMM